MRQRYKEVLANSPLTGSLDEATLNDWLHLFREHRCPKGFGCSELVREKDFLFLVEGRLQVFRSHPQTGRSLTLWLLGPGDGFDVVRLLDGQEHDVQVEALEEVVFLAAPFQQVRNWIALHPEFNSTFLPYVSQQLRCVEGLATDLGLYHTVARLARVFLRHAVRSAGDAVTVPLLHNLPNHHMAQMIGSVRQVVNHHLQNWRSHGLVSERDLVIGDLQELSAIADEAEVLHR